MTPMQSIGLLLASGALAFLAYVAAASIRLEAPASGRLAGFAGVERAHPLDRVGGWILRLTGLDLGAWGRYLEWARLGGHYRGWTVATMVGRGLAFALIGLAYAALTGAPAFYLAAPALLFMPFLRVRSKAKAVIRHTLRSIPEMAALVAAEMAAGNPPDRGVERAAEMPGVLGTLLARAVAETRRGGRPLFTKKPVRGTLVETLAEMGLPELNAFAVQLDLVAEKGVAGADLMTSIARSLAAEYREAVMRAAEELESNLVAPAALFFFLPFVAVIMAPLVVSLLRTF